MDPLNAPVRSHINGMKNLFFVVFCNRQYKCSTAPRLVKVAVRYLVNVRCHYAVQLLQLVPVSGRRVDGLYQFRCRRSIKKEWQKRHVAQCSCFRLEIPSSYDRVKEEVFVAHV